MDLADFVSKYPARDPRHRGEHPDECRPLTSQDGVEDATAPPLGGPGGEPNDDATRHLWVFEPRRVPCILESAPRATPPLAIGRAKHTNLTGGSPASCGGEFWIDEVEEGRLFVSGASGRYGPGSPEQLDDAVKVFETLGFRVTSFGWNTDTGKPYTVYFHE